tara:strand:- start:56867 stop:57454 length:588 start_codon:yes stop_codon:yes gene_type:complete
MFFYDKLISTISIEAPNVKVETYVDENKEEDIKNILRLRKVDLAITISKINEMSYKTEKLIDDKLVVLASKKHPRIKNCINLEKFLNEKHISWNINDKDKNQLFKNTVKTNIPERNVVHRSSAINMLLMVSNSEMLCLCPETIFKKFENFNILNKFETPFDCKSFSIYMNWHKSYDKEQGIVWLRKKINSIFQMK